MSTFLDTHAFHIVGLACWLIVAGIFAWAWSQDRRRQREWDRLTAVVDAARDDIDNPPLDVADAAELEAFNSLADLPHWSKP